MKVEYSYYGDMPSLIIKGTDFVKALKDREELNIENGSPLFSWTRSHPWPNKRCIMNTPLQKCKPLIALFLRQYESICVYPCLSAALFYFRIDFSGSFDEAQ